MNKQATAADFQKWEAQGKKMTDAELNYAIADCLEAAACKLDETYYLDQAFTFGDERRRRAEKARKNS
jgi:hypothetical protein